MDIVTLIRRYITNNFDVSVEDVIKIKSTHTNEVVTLSTFIADTSEIFDYNSNEVCVEWYDARLRQKIKSICRYLDKYRVFLGSVTWEVKDKDNNEFQIRDMVKSFDGVYDEKFIRKIQNDWYMDKIVKITKEMLKTSD
jgi:hypothetical protein